MAFLDSAQPHLYGPRGFEAEGWLRSLVAGGAVAIMVDDTHDKGERNDPDVDEAALSARLQSLGDKLNRTAAKRPSDTGSGHQAGGAAPNASGIARGFRLSTELVAGVLVGAGLGFVLDKWLGTSPWGLIVLLLLGFAAGVINVMRAAGIAPNPAERIDPRQ